MKLAIDYNELQLVAYEGAGNRTPVLDLSSWIDPDAFVPSDIRQMLEQDRDFRRWLQEEGNRHTADSVMIYYRSHHRDYDFVTFVGEPSADIASPFSDMCGNGIRALSLHILLSEESDVRRDTYIEEGITIWAGEPRTIDVETFIPKSEKGMFQVQMGPFQRSATRMNVFLNTFLFPLITDFSAVRMNGQMKHVSGSLMGYGFNGQETGEPHAVLLTTLDQLPQMLPVIQNTLDRTLSMDSIRKVACDLGSYVTFNTQLFPRGINFSFGVVEKNRIYMSTHERNLLPSQDQCLSEQGQEGFCHCNTLACGTGGAAAANIAYLQGLIDSPEMVTIHPGGVIDYAITDTGTVMTGPARRV